MGIDLQNPVIFNVFKNSLCPSKLLLCPFWRGTIVVWERGAQQKFFPAFAPEFSTPPPFWNSFRHLWYSAAQSINRLWLTVWRQHTHNGLNLTMQCCLLKLLWGLVNFDVRAIWRSGLSAKPHYSTLPFRQLLICTFSNLVYTYYLHILVYIRDLT